MVKLLLARLPPSNGATLQETSFPTGMKSFTKSSGPSWMNQSVFYATAVPTISLVFEGELMLKTTSTIMLDHQFKVIWTGTIEVDPRLEPFPRFIESLC